jgi:hypothetical protein
MLLPGGGSNSTIAGLKSGNPFSAIEEFKGEYRCITADLRNAPSGQSTGPIEVDRPWESYPDDHLARGASCWNAFRSLCNSELRVILCGSRKFAAPDAPLHEIRPPKSSNGSTESSKYRRRLINLSVYVVIRATVHDNAVAGLTHAALADEREDLVCA